MAVPKKVFNSTLTSERHGRSRLGEHLHVSPFARFADVVAHGATPVLATLKAHAAVEHLVAPAAVRFAGFFLVQQGVDKQVHGALVLAFDGLIYG